MVCKIFLVTILVLFSLATVEADHPRHVAYISRSIETPFCFPFPRNDVCPELNVKIHPDFMDIYNVLLNNFKSSIPDLKQSGADDKCIEAIRKLKCAEIPRCDIDGQAIDSDSALEECRKGRNMCKDSTNIMAKLLNCDEKEKQYKNSKATIHIPRASCKIIQDPNGFCPDVNYKRVVNVSINYPKYFNATKSALENLKLNKTSECYKNVKDIACSYHGACSDDGKYWVLLYTRKYCKKSMSCLPESKRWQLKNFCKGTFDADDPNVRKVSYPGYPGSSAGLCLNNSAFLVIFAVLLAEIINMSTNIQI